MKLRDVYKERAAELLAMVSAAKEHGEDTLRISKKHWQAYRAMQLNYRTKDSDIYINGIRILGLLP